MTASSTPARRRARTITGIVVATLSLALVVTAIVLHLKREALALGIANDVLAGSGFRVADLSITRLRTDEIVFSRLVLVGDAGDEIDFRDLRVPLSLPDTRIREAAVGRITITPAPGDDDASVSELLTLALTLPVDFPGTTVAVSAVEHPDWPTLTDVHWATDARSQRLTLKAASLPLEFETEVHESDRHLVRAAVGEPAALTFEAEVAPAGQGTELVGTARGDLAEWAPLLRDRGWLPESLLRIAGRTEASVHASIEVDAERRVDVSVMPRFGEDFLVEYAADGLQASILPTPDSEVSMTARYPEPAWRLEAAGFTASALSDGLGEIGIRIVEAACESGMRCNTRLSARSPSLSIADLSISGIEVSATVDITIGEETRAVARPTALKVDEVGGAGWRLGPVALRSADGLQVVSATDELTLSAKSLLLEPLKLAAGDDTTATLPLTLRNLRADVAKSEASSAFGIPGAGARLVMDGRSWVVPDLAGTFRYAGGRGTADVTANDPVRDIDARFNVTVDANSISAEFADARIGFGDAPLSASLRQWPNAWDLAAGIVRATGRLTYPLDGDDNGVRGTVDVTLENVGARHGDTGASGINGAIPVRFADDGSLDVGPGRVTAALVDIGLPLEDLSADVAWAAADAELAVNGLHFALLGGTASADPFRLDTDTLTGDIRLAVTDIQLALIAALAKFDSVEVSGALSGVVPLRIENGEVIVQQGRLENVPPGGVIRYRAGDGASTASGLGMAQRALSYLEYESLTSDVTYTPEGDLVLRMRLEGINPDMDPLQPVILNLSVENNIPQLLKSLQAARDIEQVLERRSRR